MIRVGVCAMYWIARQEEGKTKTVVVRPLLSGPFVYNRYSSLLGTPGVVVGFKSPFNAAIVWS